MLQREMIAIFVVVCGFVSSAHAAPWSKMYGGSNYDYTTSIQKTTDGGSIVAGFTASFGVGENDAWIFKLDANGATQWQQAYGTIKNDRANAVQQTMDGGYIVAGETGFSLETPSITDAWIFKLDSSGAIEWQKTYGGTGWDSASSIQQTSDGGFIAAGYTDSGALNYDLWVLKLDSNGTIEWQKAYGGSGSDSARAIQETSDGGYIVAGRTKSFRTDNGTDAWVLKLDHSGAIQWQKTYDTIYQFDGYAESIQQTTDQGYIVGGYFRLGSGGVKYARVWKLASNGDIEWLKEFGGSDFAASSVRQTADSGYIVAGGVYSAWVAKLDGNGNVQWQKTFDTFAASSTYQAEDGGYVVAGSDYAGATQQEAVVMKLDGSGNIAGCFGGTPGATTTNANGTVNNTDVEGLDTFASEVETMGLGVVANAMETDLVLCYPAMNVSPLANYYFGNVFVGSTSSPQTYTLSNTGTGNLVISSIGMVDLQAEMFQVATGGGANACPNLTPTLSPGASCTFVATFTPVSAGYKYTILRISGNDPDLPTVDIGLMGNGIVAPDLAITALTAPATAKRGGKITITDTTKNQGTGTSPSSTMKLYLSTNNTYSTDDVTLGSRAVPGLAAGGLSSGSVVVTVPRVSAGTYYIIAIADADNTIPESNETNNNKVQSIKLK